MCKTLEVQVQCIRTQPSTTSKSPRPGLPYRQHIQYLAPKVYDIQSNPIVGAFSAGSKQKSFSAEHPLSSADPGQMHQLDALKAAKYLFQLRRLSVVEFVQVVPHEHSNARVCHRRCPVGSTWEKLFRTNCEMKVVPKVHESEGGQMVSK